MSPNASKPPSARPPAPPATPSEQALHRKDSIGQVEGEALEAAVGAVAGAAIGAIAGPIGAAAGAAVGGAVGVALAREIRRSTHEEVLHERQVDAGELEDLPEEEAEQPLPGLSADQLEKELEKK